MGMLDLASRKSCFRGYEYYKNNKILTKNKISDTQFSGVMQGSNNNKYDVFIDIEHPRKSHCNCPLANGKKIICKHQIALYFSFFPSLAKEYNDYLIMQEQEAEKYQIELDDKIEKYLNKCSKVELQQIIYDLLYSGEDWVFEKFVRQYVDY